MQRPLLLALATLAVAPAAATAAECPTLSGVVYHDANDNGLRGPSETRIGGVSLALRNAAGQIVATAVTDAQGRYSFSTDATISTAPTAQTQALSFPSLATNVTATQAAAQFNPNLGTLTAVDVITSGSLTSTIRVESQASSPNTVGGEVSGSLTLDAPGFGPVVTNVIANTQQIPLAAADGVLDFAGASGHDFGAVSASGSATASSAAPTTLQLYTGTGSVLFAQVANATSRAVDQAGNVVVNINTVGRADVTLVYRYVPSGCLAEGSYTILETQPEGWQDGRETAGNLTPIPNSKGRDEITVTLGSSPLTQLNFGELRPNQRAAGEPEGPPTRIAVTKGRSRAQVRAGQHVAFTIRFRVPGAATALNVKVCDRLPDGMTYVAAPGARFEKGNACWRRTQVQPGTVLRFVVRARVDRDASAGILVNRAIATASNAPTARDDVPVRITPGTTRGRGVPVTG